LISSFFSVCNPEVPLAFDFSPYIIRPYFVKVDYPFAVLTAAFTVLF
jgi:hypothetical protein